MPQVKFKIYSLCSSFEIKVVYGFFLQPVFLETNYKEKMFYFLCMFRNENYRSPLQS